MNTLDATGNKIGDIKFIDGHYRIVKVGAFTDSKTGEYYSQLRWYRLSGKEERRYLRLLEVK